MCCRMEIWIHEYNDNRTKTSPSICIHNTPLKPRSETPKTKSSNHLLTPPTLTKRARPLNRILYAPHVLHDLVRNLWILRLEIVPLRPWVSVNDELER